MWVKFKYHFRRYIWQAFLKSKWKCCYKGQVVSYVSAWNGFLMLNTLNWLEYHSLWTENNGLKSDVRSKEELTGATITKKIILLWKTREMKYTNHFAERDTNRQEFLAMNICAQWRKVLLTTSKKDILLEEFLLQKIVVLKMKAESMGFIKQVWVRM